MKEREQQAFKLRAKPSGVDRLQEALDKDQIVIGWAEAEELKDESLSRDEFDDIFESYYPGKPSRYMWLFIREMNIGDLVVVPSGSVFYVARILGPATHDKSKIKEDTAYRRKVEWLNNKKPIDKAKAKPGLQKTLNHIPTACHASHRLQEIKECLNDAEIDSNPTGSQAEANTMKDPHPLNTILYGPPGTGKTYNTSHYAVAIIEGNPVEDVKKEDHEEVKNKFDKYRDDGQIKMVTFHQNYAYEDFIEGIRPVLDEAGEGDVKYELRKGVFKDISDRATIDKLLQAFAISIQKELESGQEIKLSDDGGINDTIKAVDRVKNDFSFKLGGSGEGKSLSMQSIKEHGYYHRFLQGELQGRGDIKNIEESQSPQLGTAPQYFALLKKIKEFHDSGEWNPETRSSKEEGRVKKYVLVIDEINRGNIAKIFGELITLIEESRRLGEREATEVTLPYSGESFGVPNNLYIIGTMNTADRSIALLDTALRRRFEFKEMMPDPALLSDASTNIDGVNCKDLLEAMNKRIRVLFDREHQIGHTYFLTVKDMDALEKTFKNKIIPLLQEYFYDNYEKINLVLNKNKFIKEGTIPKGLDEDRDVYELLPYDDKRWRESGQYRKIYGESEEDKNEEKDKLQ